MTSTLYRPVPGLPDLYAGADGTIVKAGYGVLEPKLYKNSRYYTVYTRCGRKGGTRSVHSLVAAAFLGEPAEGMVVRHGLGGEFDNSIGNLCYGTQQDNIGDSIERGVHHSVTHSQKQQCDKGHDLTPENIYTRPGTTFRRCRICRKAERRRAYIKQHGREPQPRATREV